MRFGLDVAIGHPFAPVSLHSGVAALSPKVWYDPSDWDSLYQDSAGTTPVTAVGDPVGLMLDKSGNGFNASQSVSINRPTLEQDANGKYYLEFNGANSRMTTSAIDLSGTDKITLIAGVSKVSDDAAGMIVEFSANASANNGAFYLLASDSAGQNYRVLIRGSAIGGAIPGSIPAPNTSVLAATATLAATGAFLLRRNAVQHTSSTPSFGAVNFGNYQLFIGHRSGGFIHFNGGLYGFILRAADSTLAEIQNAEKYMNLKSGAY